MTDQQPPYEDAQAERDRMLDAWDESAKGWARQADRTMVSARPV
jgi:hypothetical protein